MPDGFRSANALYAAGYATRRISIALAPAAATDPYQPAEREHDITRGILPAMTQAQGRHLGIQTRGPLADNPVDLASCRDIIANGGQIQLNMTLTINAAAVRKACEPTGPSYRRRLDTAANIAQQQYRKAASRNRICPAQAKLWDTNKAQAEVR